MSLETTKTPRYFRDMDFSSPDFFEQLFDVREERIWRHRQRDESMLAAVNAGWSTQQIAQKLHVSLRTVQLGIRRAKIAQRVESPQAQMTALRRLIDITNSSQPRTAMEFFKLALRVEHEMNELMGSRPTPKVVAQAHKASAIARQPKTVPHPSISPEPQVPALPQVDEPAQRSIVLP